MKLCAVFTAVHVGPLAHAVDEGSSVDYRQCAPPDFESCFAPENPNLVQPFELRQSTPGVPAALLIHGFTDSPYYMKDIALHLHQAGYHVLALRLAGHGTHPEALRLTKLQDWHNDVEKAIQRLSLTSKQILIGGFSTGGALSLWAARQFPQIKGVLLFSPALRIRDPRAPLSCLGDSPFTGPWVRWMDEDNPIRYRKMALNGVCQVYHATHEIHHRPNEISQPVFTVFSEADELIDPTSSVRFLRRLPHPGSRTLMYSKSPWYRHVDQDSRFQRIPLSHVGHTQIPLRTNEVLKDEVNPDFESLVRSLGQFLQSLP